MIVAINDLPFRSKMSSKAEAIEAIRKWMEICKELESDKVSAVEGIYSGVIDRTLEIAPQYKLIQLVKEFQTREERSYLIHLLVNLPVPDMEDVNAFYFKGMGSKICAWAKEGIVVSAITDITYAEDKLVGVQNDQDIEINNIAQKQHLELYKSALGIRKYEPNPKHRKNAYYDGAGRYVDEMDLNDDEAQNLLNHAIDIDGKLYGKMNGNYYCFQNHHDNCYHGYCNKQLPIHITKKIDQEFARP